MAERRRFFEPGHCYHVLNRGVKRQRLFFDGDDYAAFECLMWKIQEQVPLTIFTYELMPNHWHFVVRPQTREEMSSYFQLLAGTHAKRFRIATGTQGEGHVYQDRFKSFPVQSDGHFLTLCRYVERNALRAKLVQRAEAWRWSGLWHRLHESNQGLTSDWPVARPSNWTELVNAPMTAQEIAPIRKSIRRGAPLGDVDWVARTAAELGLEHSLRRPGRPRFVRR